MRTDSTRLSLVMPAFNEEAGIVEAVAEAHESLVGLGYEFEILVVDDGSRDRTAYLVNELAETRSQVRLIRHAMNRGYGAALRSGFEAARFDLVAFTDADAQFHLEDLEDLVVLTRECPVAVGYRADRQDPWRRKFYSRGYNRLVRFFLNTGVRDCDCALKVFQREALGFLLPESRGFFVNAEMLFRARQLNWDVAEVPVRHRPRRRGQSTVSLREIPKTLRTLLGFWWKNVVTGSPRVPVLQMPVSNTRRTSERAVHAD
ncbi:glycosyltransferase family 2 protein [Zavarzinella formosa]|uniref:glycosyltransferase family 2 protein n=1 Tax=Zavarzinella formosa TaxID=360055 RepID=UPI0002FB839A|nr:glycosyltransferase family 2 protein [Zavarzinella formosa]